MCAQGHPARSSARVPACPVEGGGQELAISLNSQVFPLAAPPPESHPGRGRVCLVALAAADSRVHKTCAISQD